jgi:lipoate-protein ligase A
MTVEWRLLVDPPARGAWNMAVDEALAEAVDEGASPSVVRFYGWSPPCLSLGASQPFTAADTAFCAAEGIDIVRRPTGGRAVLHHLELTYLVTARLGRNPFTHELQEVYRSICRALVVGLRGLGVAAEVAGDPPEPLIRPVQAIPCFVGPAAGEVVVAGRKLVGSAMRRVGGTVLQHGALLVGWDSRLQAGCLGLADDASLRAAVVTLGDLLAVQPGSGAVADALAAGFAEHFDVALSPSRLTAAEATRARVLERERYGHERWTASRDRSCPV